MKWIIENDEVVGTIDLRHLLNKDYFERLGHVCLLHSSFKRKKGYATKAVNVNTKMYKNGNLSMYKNGMKNVHTYFVYWFNHYHYHYQFLKYSFVRI